MGTLSMRRSDRVSLTVAGSLGHRYPRSGIQRADSTMLINRGGAVIVLERELGARATDSWRQAKAILRKPYRPAHRGPVRQAKGRDIFTGSKYWTLKRISGELNFRRSRNPQRRSRECCCNAATAEPRGRLSERTRAARIRNQSRHRATLQNMRCAQHLDASPHEDEKSDAASRARSGARERQTRFREAKNSARANACV